METEWYVEDDGRTTGPFTVRQLKAQAAADRIQPETRIRKGRSGKWHTAKNVKGLLAESASPTSDRKQAKLASKSAAGSAAGVSAKEASEEGTYLAPLRNRKRRLIIFICLVIFILIGQSEIQKQLFFDVTVGLLLGSYPVVEVKKKKIEQTLMVFFIPVHKKVLKLRDFVSVETEMEARIADTIGCLVLVVFWLWFLFRFFDHLVPWLGGNYKLLLRRYDDERVLIWQGNSAADFEANLELLRASGLEIA